MTPGRIDVAAHAKINLALRVLDREESGYHQIETIFCALTLADDISIALEGDSITLDVQADVGADGHAGLRAGRSPVPDLGPTESNLAWRAAALYAADARLNDGIRITLVKRIPAGAGLGGGSSDAAAVLSALNRMHDGVVPAERLLELGAMLGSDVPFFLRDAPLALARGRGELITPLPTLPVCSVVLAVPPERVSTRDAYAALDSARADAGYSDRHRERMFDVQLKTWSDIAAVAINDFEDVIFARHPRLAHLRRAFEESGATVARMTGTGSVVFGMFDDHSTARAVAEQLSRSDPDVEILIAETRSGV